MGRFAHCQDTAGAGDAVTPLRDVSGRPTVNGNVPERPERPLTNERLRAAISAAGYDLAGFAADVGVDPKTAERWITTDRVPHRAHRMTAAAKLAKSDGYLWPTTYNDAASQSATEAELVKLYPSRGAVPIQLWIDLVSGAEESIDILVYAGSFLHDSIPGFVEALGDRAEAGVRVRLILGDPNSAAVELRGREEAIADSMAARCKLSRQYFGPAGRRGVQIRLHGTTLYASIFRFDSDILVNPHLLGVPASQSPLLHLSQIAGGRLFDRYSEAVGRVWTGAIDAVIQGDASPMNNSEQR